MLTFLYQAATRSRVICPPPSSQSSIRSRTRSLSSFNIPASTASSPNTPFSNVSHAPTRGLTRQRVLSSPIKVPHMPSQKHALDSSTPPGTPLSRVGLPLSTFVHRINPRRTVEPSSASCSFIPSPPLPRNTLAHTISAEMAVRRGSASTVDSKMTGTSMGTRRSKRSKLCKWVSVLSRLFERHDN